MKLSLSPITSGYLPIATLNANFDAIEDAVQNTLSRDGTIPNVMQANLDLNGYSILNQGNPVELSGGFNWEGPWVTATAYSVGDAVESGNSSYVCVVAHTSGTFATDLAATKWQIIAGASSLPSQSGKSGYHLTSNGSSAVWNSLGSTLHTLYPAVTTGGVTDNHALLQAAVDSLTGGGRIMLPAGDIRISDTLEILVSGITIEGTGYSTRIVGDLSLPTIIKFGDRATVTVPVRSGLRNLTVTRAAGTVPDGSIGVDHQLFNYAFDDHVSVERSAINRRITGRSAGISIQYDCFAPMSRSAKEHHMQIGNAAGIKVYGGQLGMNGGETYDCTSMVDFTDLANDITFHGTNLIPTGPGVSKPAVFSFTDYTNTGGIVLKLTDVDSENTSYFMISDATSTALTDITIHGCRIACETGAFNLNSASQITSMILSGSTISVPMTLTNPKWITIGNCSFGGTVTLVGGSDAVVNMSTCSILVGDLVLSGAWDNLTIAGVSLPSGGSITNTATGTVSIDEAESHEETLTVTANTGTFTDVAGTGLFRRSGNFVVFDAVITITTRGSADGWINVTLPTRYGLPTRIAAVTGYHGNGTLMYGGIAAGTRAINVIRKYDGTYLGGDGSVIYLSGKYPVV